jgi:two-component system chemotaxis sensor kinase CheA
MSDDLLQHFVLEARELVQIAGEDLLALDRSPADAERIDSLFRAVHTLKGSAGLFDFAPLTEILHAAEDVMSAVRDRRLAAAGPVIQPLLRAIAAVEHGVESIARDGAQPPEAEDEAAGLVAALRACLADSPAAANAPPEQRTGPPPGWIAGLLARHAGVITAAEAAGERLMALRYRPDRDCFFRGEDPLAVVRALPALRAVAFALAKGEDEAGGQYDPFACMLEIDILSAAPAGQLNPNLRLLGGQMQMAPVVQPPAAPPQGTGAQAPAMLRIDARRIDALADLAGELVVAKNALAHAAAASLAAIPHASPEVARALTDSQAAIARLVGEMQRGVAGLRSVSLAQTFRRLPRIVRETAGRLDKQVRLEIHGAETTADRLVADGLYEPLLHGLRNAVDHGIETAEARLKAGKPAAGLISLTAVREGDQVIVTVSDDGAGMDPARLRETALRRGLMPEAAIRALDDRASLDLVFAPGFSTAKAVTDVSGRGVGLDAVRRSVEAIGGKVSISSVPGQGSTLRIAVTLAAAVRTLILVRVGGERYGVPLETVAETALVPARAIQKVQGQAAFVLRDRTIPLLALSELLGGPPPPDDADRQVLIAAIGGERVGIAVDGFAERVDVVPRPLCGPLAGLPGAQATAILGDGGVLLVLDLADLIARRIRPAP